MPIPPLVEHGLLPDGVHDCTLAEIDDSFGKFQLRPRAVGFRGKTKPEHRLDLSTRLKAYVDELGKSPIPVACVLVDGSFCTSKDEPSDVDVALVLKADLPSDLPPAFMNLLDKTYVRRRFHIDVAHTLTTEEEVTAVEFFAQVKPGQLPEQPDGLPVRKGMLRVAL